MAESMVLSKRIKEEERSKMKLFDRCKRYLIRSRHPVLAVIVLLGLLILSLILMSGLFAKREHAAIAQQEAGVPVTTATVTVETVALQIGSIGTIEAYSTVSVKSQINGELTKVYFTEGQYVKKGDPLFTIDPRFNQADLQQALANQSRAIAQQRQAEANLARDTAQANTAQIQAQRYAMLYEKGVVSKEQYDQIRTNAESLAAVLKADQAAVATEQESVRAAKAAVEASRVQLDYTSIRSPIDGRTGSLMVNQGNLVKITDTTPLVVINQVNPIYVSFAVPESQLTYIKRYMAQASLEVTATIPNDSGPPERGTLTFVDNAVDRATGTVKLKATFENNERRLWPGQFVNTVLNLATQPDLTVVPSQAVQTGQQGQYVFVVNSDQRVELRPVVVTRTAGEKAVIERGLQAGEVVVTDGQLRLRPGSKIRATTEQPDQTNQNQ
jgi:multidrug efflux system membrane fusion protein